VVEGYDSAAARRVSIHRQSLALAALFSGDSSFDVYTRAVSDVYQIFSAKAVYR